MPICSDNRFECIPKLKCLSIQVHHQSTNYTETSTDTRKLMDTN